MYEYGGNVYFVHHKDGILDIKIIIDFSIRADESCLYNYDNE
jgi:hypothetical protein